MSDSDSQAAALALFESFLESYHAGKGRFDELCASHPEHHELFSRWWEQLVKSGEVTGTPPGE